MKKNKEEKKEEMHQWETVEDFNYRNTIVKISNRMHKILGKMESYMKTFNFSIPMNEIKKEYSYLCSLQCPTIYKEISKLYIDGLEYYIKGFDCLDSNSESIKSSVKNSRSNSNKYIGVVTKAGSFVECGNNYTKIVNVKIYELFERKQKEFEKQKQF